MPPKIDEFWRVLVFNVAQLVMADDMPTSVHLRIVDKALRHMELWDHLNETFGEDPTAARQGPIISKT